MSDHEKRTEEITEVLKNEGEELVEIDDNGNIVVLNRPVSGNKPVVIRDPHGEYAGGMHVIYS